MKLQIKGDNSLPKNILSKTADKTANTDFCLFSRTKKPRLKMSHFEVGNLQYWKNFYF